MNHSEGVKSGLICFHESQSLVCVGGRRVLAIMWDMTDLFPHMTLHDLQFQECKHYCI